jgi:cytochrome c1
MCHGQTAEKKFDPAKPDADHVSITMKGRDDVTPKMPGYEAKGVTEEQAKALVAFMRSIRQ